MPMPLLLFGYKKFYGLMRRWARLTSIKPFDLKKNHALKLELGGGETPAKKGEGFLNVDLRPRLEVDHVCAAWDLTANFGIDSVSYLYSRHMVEHLTYSELNKALEDWQAVLCPGGVLELVVPNQTYHLLQLLSVKFDDPEYLHGLAGFHGWQRCGRDGNYWDVHKSSFTCAHLLALLQNYFEFSDHKFIFDSAKNVHFIGQTR